MSITSWLSMSSRLQRLPTSLAKHTLSACHVLLAYLIISAVRMLVVHHRRLDLAVERFGRLRVRRVVVADQRHRRMAEVLDRRALAQELGVHRDAEPGPVLLARRPLERRNHHLVRRPRQHGAADDDDVVAVLVLRAPRQSARRRAPGRSGRGCRSGGSACRRRSARGRSRRRPPSVLVVARSRPLAALSRISSSSPFSTIGLRPSLRLATLSGLTSTPTTVWPSAANDAADTLPTYPRPNTETFIVRCSLRRNGDRHVVGVAHREKARVPLATRASASSKSWATADQS